MQGTSGGCVEGGWRGVRGVIAGVRCLICSCDQCLVPTLPFFDIILVVCYTILPSKLAVFLSILHLCGSLRPLSCAMARAQQTKKLKFSSWKLREQQ